MQGLSPRAVPFNYCTTWISVTWKIIMVNYLLALGATYFLIGMGLVGYFLGTLGGAFASGISTLLTPGILLIGSDFSKKNKSNFDLIFTGFRDRDLLSRLLPLVLFNILFALINGHFTKNHVLVGTVISLLVAPFTYFAVPLMTFDKISFINTIPLSLQAVIKNIVPLVLFIILIALLATGLGLLLFLPLVFYGLPLIMFTGYPVYASIFLNMDVDALNQSLLDTKSDT